MHLRSGAAAGRPSGRLPHAERLDAPVVVVPQSNDGQVVVSRLRLGLVLVQCSLHWSSSWFPHSVVAIVASKARRHSWRFFRYLRRHLGASRRHGVRHLSPLQRCSTGPAGPGARSVLVARPNGMAGGGGQLMSPTARNEKSRSLSEAALRRSPDL